MTGRLPIDCVSELFSKATTGEGIAAACGPDRDYLQPRDFRPTFRLRSR